MSAAVRTLARVSPMPLPEDWPSLQTSDLDLRTANAFLTAQTAYQAGRIQQMQLEYDDLADDFNEERRDNATMRREHTEMQRFIEVLTGGFKL